MILQTIPAVAPTVLTVVTAIATDMPGSFFSNHPDAAIWTMSALVSITCLMAMNSYRKLCREIKDLKNQANSNKQDIAVIKQVCEDREKLCPIYKR
jgi:hypothetical protein